MIKTSISVLFLFLIACQGNTPVTSPSDILIHRHPTLASVYVDSLDGKQFYTDFKSMIDSIANANVESLPQLIPYLSALQNRAIVDSSLVRKCAIQLGYKLNSASLIDDAIEVYQKAHQCYQQGKSKDLWYCENQLGILYNIKGDHERSLYYYVFADKELSRLIENQVEGYNNLQTQRERLQNNIAILEYWSSKYTSAQHRLRQNILTAHRHNNTIAKAYSLQLLIDIFFKKANLDSAHHYIALFEKAIQDVPDDKKNILTDQLEKAKGNYFAKEGDHQQSKSHLRKLLTSSPSQSRNRDHAKTFNQLSQVHLALMELDSAYSSVQQGFRCLLVEKDSILNKRQIYEENTIAELSETLLKIYKAKYNENRKPEMLDSAIMAGNAAIMVYDILRNKYLLENSKIQSIEDHRGVVNQLIDLTYQRYQSNKDSLTMHIVPLVKKSKNLLLINFEAERLALENKILSGDSKTATLTQKVRTLTASYFVAKDETSQREIELQIVQAKQDLLDYIDIGDLDQEAFQRPFAHVEYIITSEYVYAIDNFDKHHTRFHLIGTTDTLYSMLEPALALLSTRGDHQTLDLLLQKLYTFLLVPIGNLPSEFAVYPDGMLHLLPFSALVDQQRQYLVQNHTIWLGFDRLQPKSTDYDNLQILMPEYPADTLARDLGLIPLIFTEQEAAAVEKHWPGHVEQHKHPIDKTTLFTALQHGDALHYIGHTIEQDGNIYLALSNDASTLVSTQELTRSHLNCKLVVLSACATGKGELQLGEGINSLAKGFMNAGSDEVVYSLWNVNDQTTSAIMSAFYNQFATDNNATTALSHAQKSYLNNHDGDALHPYYWAAFSVSAGVTYPNNQPTIYWQLMLLMSLIALLTYIYLKSKHKTK